MKFKIIKIKGCKTCTEVLIARIQVFDEKTETDKQKVELSAWHTQDGSEYYQFEQINFDDSYMLADRYVSDFSEVSANDFVKDFSF